MNDGEKIRHAGGGKRRFPRRKKSEVRRSILLLDLTYARKYLVWGRVFTIRGAVQVESEFKKHLMLLAENPEESLIPPDQVCEFQNACVLDTAKYRELCESVFGKFLDHSFCHSPHTKEYKRGAGAWQRAYREKFGALPPWFTFTGGCVPRESRVDLSAWWNN